MSGQPVPCCLAVLCAVPHRLHVSLCCFRVSRLVLAGARLISFSDVIEIKGAAAAAATKEKESRDYELAQLQARCRQALLRTQLNNRTT
jgi:hypothetical protein